MEYSIHQFQTCRLLKFQDGNYSSSDIDCVQTVPLKEESKMIFQLSAFGLFVIMLIVYFFIQRFFYWEKRGVKNIPVPMPYFMGNLKSFDKKISFAQFVKSAYDKFRGVDQFFGIHFFVWPVAVVTDLDLVKNILIENSNVFSDRQLYHDETNDPLSAHLVTLFGEKWKMIRKKLTPTFNPIKMKCMFPTIAEVTNRFADRLKESLEINNELNVKDFLSKLSTDLIGTFAFGIDPDETFHNMSRRAIDNPRHSPKIELLLNYLFDWGRRFKVKIIQNDVTEYFLNMVQDTVNYRENNQIRRNDFMDSLIQIKNDPDIEKRLTIGEITAQAVLFIVGGAETSSLTIMYTLYELALNSQIQTRARNEIKKVLAANDGTFSYDILNEMTYLNQIIKETMRKYPAFTMLRRVAQKDYTVPNTNHVIEKGTLIIVPVYSIHRDPNYYPNPDVYDPERFTIDAEKSRHPMAWLPFGTGPRNCIAFKFAMTQFQIILITLLRKFEVTVCENTMDPMVFKPSILLLKPNDKLYLKFKSL